MLIKEVEAEQQIERIGSEATRLAVHLLLKAVKEYYSHNPSSLVGDLDLAFLVDVLEYDIEDLQELLLHRTPRGYWDDPSPEWFKIRSLTSTDRRSAAGIRTDQANDFCGAITDVWLGYGLLSVLSIADLKRQLMNKNVPHRHWPIPGKQPVAPAEPASPLDELFVVEALCYALRTEGPARALLEGRS
jgi:hypothetical protein